MKKKIVILSSLFLSSIFLSSSICIQLISANEDEKDPIVLVHGFIGDGGLILWDTMIDRLVADGWDENLIFEIIYSNPVFGSNVGNAEELAVYIDNVLAQTGAEKVDIIGHSMGGLSSRWYIKFLGGVDKVDDYISLGTPQHGTWLASIPLLPLLSAGTIEMRAGSRFLRKLNNGDETPGDVSYTSIYSSTDELVWPYALSKLYDGATNIQVNGVSHVGLLFDNTVFNHVVTTLS